MDIINDLSSLCSGLLSSNVTLCMYMCHLVLFALSFGDWSLGTKQESDTWAISMCKTKSFVSDPGPQPSASIHKAMPN